MYMTKCITLSDDAYNNLKSLKKNNESFSEIVKRLASVEKREGLLNLAGVWKGNPDAVKAMKSIYKDRKNIKLRNFN